MNLRVGNRFLKFPSSRHSGLVRVYISNIRPVLCYAAPAWYPYVTKHAKGQLESAQRHGHCLKIMLPDLSYSEILTELNMPSINDFLEQQCTNFVIRIKPGSSLEKFAPEGAKDQTD